MRLPDSRTLAISAFFIRLYSYLEKAFFSRQSSAFLPLFRAMKNKPFPHDHLFKEVFSQPKYLLELLNLVFSKREINLFNWATTKTEATTFIDKESREQRMDLLVSALFKKSKRRGRVLFLMEHKSHHDQSLFLDKFFL